MYEVMKYFIIILFICLTAYPSLAIIDPAADDSATMINSNDSGNDKIVIVLPPGLGQSEVVVSRSSTGKDETLPEDMQLLGVSKDNVQTNNSSKDLPDDMKDILGNTNNGVSSGSSVSSPQNITKTNSINPTTGSVNNIAVDKTGKTSSSTTKILWFIMVAVILFLILSGLYMSFSHKKNIVFTEKV